MEKILFSENWERIASGSYGTYYKMSENEGIKIFRKKPIDVFRKTLSEYIEEEFNLLSYAYKKTKMCPKPVKTVRVIIGKKCYPAYIMEHIDSLDTEDYLYEDSKFYKLYRKGIASLLNTFNRSGIRHDDLHEGNVLVKKISKDKIKVYAIDFTPSYIFIDRNI